MTVETLHILGAVAGIGQHTVFTGDTVPAPFVGHCVAVSGEGFLDILVGGIGAGIFTWGGGASLRIAGIDTLPIPSVLARRFAVVKR